MTPNTLDEQLTKYLRDVHSIEQQVLVQMKRAPGLADDAEIAAHFSQHLIETQDQERLVRERLEARSTTPSKVKDLVGAATGVGFALFAAAQPDTPGKLVAHASSYEHMEIAAYDLLARVAERAGDSETVEVAREIGRQEQAMAQRLAESFDRAAEASLREVFHNELDEQLVKYLADAHAIEAQAAGLLEKGPKLAHAEELAEAYEEHLDETLQHQQLVRARLEARGGSPSKLKDAALSLGALNWGGFFAAQPDTPAKLAGFSYAFEHLEIAAYELLRRVARQAEDADTDAAAEQILAQERAAAERIRSLFGQALDASLQAQDVTVR
jgi:ferritin-like metal-binding protein YciE